VSKTPGNRIYNLSHGDKQIFAKAADPSDGVGVNWFTSFYFGGRELRSWQWAFHHAAQRQITVVGGVGSGKTVGAGLSYATWCATTPMFKFMNLAPTGWQSKLMYEAVMRESIGREFERFIFKTIERPYPTIIFKSDYIGESRMEFMSAADCVSGDTILKTMSPNGDLIDSPLSIEEMATKGIAPTVVAWDHYGTRFRFAKAKVPYHKGKKPLFEVTLKSGQSIKVAENHRFFHRYEWKSMREILNNTLENPVEIGVFRDWAFCHEEIDSVKELPEQDYFDLEVPRFCNYVAHDFVNHNSAERIQGWEGDAMNLDEAGVLMDGDWLLIMMVTRMRGNVPIPQGGFRPRLKKMSVITANYDFAPPWLWARMDKMSSCLLYTSPSPRDRQKSRMPSSA